jgi:hypothetical protein
MFVIEDELHGEWIGEFGTLGEAIAELERRSLIPWDAEPNRAPCESWRTCGRAYEILEYAETNTSTDASRKKALEVSADGIKWHLERSS